MKKINDVADTYSYKGWLLSDSILKRSFAIMGHYLLALISVYAIIFLAAFFIICVAGLLSLIFG